MSAWEWIAIAAAITLNFGGSLFYARAAEHYRSVGRAAFAEAAEANRQINEALVLFSYGARDEAFEIMKALEEKNKRFIAEMERR